MKRLIALPLAVFFCLLVIFSCDKKDETPANPLIGTWKFSSSVRSGCTDPLDNGIENCTGTKEECGYIVIAATTYTFYPPTGSGDPNETGTYTVSGSTITTSPTGAAPQTATYAVAGGTLTFSQVDSGSGCTEVTTLVKQ